MAAVGSSCVRGLLLAGRLDEADQAAQRYREHCQDTPGPGEVITSSMFGHVAKSRGQVRTAARWFRQVLAADTGGWEFAVLCDLPGVLGMAGEATSARQALMEELPQAARRVERRRGARRGPRRGAPTMSPSRWLLDGAEAPAAATGATSGAGGPVSAAICSAPGRTLVVTGLMPACRVSVRISPD